MKTRRALSIALSALLVFNSVPSSALRAFAEEVSPQVELAETPDDTTPTGDVVPMDPAEGEGQGGAQEEESVPGDTGDEHQGVVPADGQESVPADSGADDGEASEDESKEGEPTEGGVL